MKIQKEDNPIPKHDKGKKLSISHICPICKNRDMVCFPIEEASVNDGDGIPDYYTVDYWYCDVCDKYFDENMEECDKPEQQWLI